MNSEELDVAVRESMEVMKINHCIEYGKDPKTIDEEIINEKVRRGIPEEEARNTFKENLSRIYDLLAKDLRKTYTVKD